MIHLVKMGQREVLKVLESNPSKYFSSKEICKILKSNKYSSTVSTSLRKMRRFGEIDFKLIDGTFLYRYKPQKIYTIS